MLLNILDWSENSTLNTQHSTLQPEAELLLACARTTPDTAAVQRIGELLREPLDWDIIIDLARRHAVEALVYSTLQRNFAQVAPPAVMAELRAYYLAGAQRSMGLTAELLQLMRLFEASGIQALPLKGPALAALAYGNLSLRWSSDLDILVRSTDVIAAKDILIARGFVPERFLNERQEALHIRTHYEYTFQRVADGMCVELHYRFRPRYFGFTLGAEEIWRQLDSVRVSGVSLPSLASADLLLFLCAHATNHCWVRLAWICDIAELIRSQPQLDWHLVQHRARELGSERMLRLGLMLAHDLLGAPVPKSLLQSASSDRVAHMLTRQIRNRLFDLSINEPEPNLFSGTLFRLRSRERWRDRLRYCLGVATITTMEDWDLLPLPTSLAWVYSLIRPFRLAGAYGSDLLKLLPAWHKR